jgi:hypothetical protein
MDPKQINRDERHQDDVRMQMFTRDITEQRNQRLAERQSEHRENQREAEDGRRGAHATRVYTEATRLGIGGL